MLFYVGFIKLTLVRIARSLFAFKLNLKLSHLIFPYPSSFKRNHFPQRQICTGASTNWGSATTTSTRLGRLGTPGRTGRNHLQLRVATWRLRGSDQQSGRTTPDRTSQKVVVDPLLRHTCG